MEHVTVECSCKGKQCTGCKTVRCIGNFNKDKTKKDGLYSECKVCRAKKDKIRRSTPEYQEKQKAYLEQPEVQARIQERRKTYSSDPAYKARRNAKLKDRYQNDPAYKEHILAQQKNRYSQHSTQERVRTYRKAYWQRPEVQARAQIRGKTYYRENRERLLAQQKSYQSRPEIKERRRAYLRDYQKRFEVQNKKRDYYRRNREQILAQNKVYRSQPEVQERIRSYRKIYNSRPGNQVRRQAYLKIYNNRSDVQEQRSIYGKAYRKRNIERIIKQKRASYLENREQILARDKEYRNRPEVQARKQINDKLYRNRPENKERRRNTAKIRYNSDLEYKQQIRLYQKEHSQRSKVRQSRYAYLKAYRSRVDVQERERAYRKAYYQRPEVKLRSPINYHTRRARKKAVPGTYTIAQIQEQLKRQRYRCYYAACGHAKFQRANGKYVYHIDHTFPLSRVAGTDIPANDASYLVLTCPTCNQSKGNKFPWEWTEGGRLL